LYLSNSHAQRSVYGHVICVIGDDVKSIRLLLPCPPHALYTPWNRGSLLQSVVTCTVDTHVTCRRYQGGGGTWFLHIRSQKELRHHQCTPPSPHPPPKKKENFQVLMSKTSQSSKISHFLSFYMRRRFTPISIQVRHI
jgi:hypothetical protein